jgi:hypothetical protein
VLVNFSSSEETGLGDARLYPPAVRSNVWVNRGDWSSRIEWWPSSMVGGSSGAMDYAKESCAGLMIRMFQVVGRSVMNKATRYVSGLKLKVRLPSIPAR